MSSEQHYRRQRSSLEAELAAREQAFEHAVADLAEAASPGGLVARHPYGAALGALAVGVLIGWR